jgi:NAD(P)H-nitrite reductase large subunit
VAHQYATAGAQVVAVLDTTPFLTKVRHAPGLLTESTTFAKGLWYTARNKLRGLNVRYGVQALRAEGARQVEALVFRDRAGKEHRIACDGIGASFGLRSEAQLADLAGCAFGFDAVERQWRPQTTQEGRSSVPDIYLAGDGARIGGADIAELQGRRTALAVLEDLGRRVAPSETGDLDRALKRQAGFRRALEAAYPFPAHLLDDVGDDEIVCRCEGVTAGALRRAACDQDAPEVNRLKALTRVGMGRCQGRVCGHVAAELLARARGCPIESVGRLRAQPPIKPIPVLGGDA